VGISPGVQQELFVRLVAAGVGFFVLIVFGAYLFVTVIGPRSARAVAPVLDEYLKAGAAGNTAAAHRLYSTAALSQVTINDVADQQAARASFEGYDHLDITDLRIARSTAPGGGDVATVKARITYRSGSSGVLDATLQREDGRWRLNQVTISRTSP
jgi:hypothetical protein